jgi:hypothetical protein
MLLIYLGAFSFLPPLKNKIKHCDNTRGHALEFSVKLTIPVSRVKVAVHTYATGLFKMENYSEFDVSLSIHYYKNIYFGTGSVILYIWPF